MLKIFLNCTVPVLALACLWFGLVFLVGGLRMLQHRLRCLIRGLHAGSAVRRHCGQSGMCYIPVFSYTDSKGEEMDIMGEMGYATEQEALKARRPLVYDAERPDAAMANSAVSYIARPLFFLLASGFLIAATHYLLLVMAD